VLPAGRIEEAELVRRAAGGDCAARRNLAGLLLDPMRRTVFLLLGADPEAEDVAQESLLRALDSIQGFRGECALATWADRIAARAALRHAEKRKRRIRLFERFWQTAAPARPADDVTDLRAVRGRLLDILDRLPHERRFAVVLHHVQGFDVAEIAEMTQTPYHTVRDRLREGRRQLRRHLLADPLLREWSDRSDT
jgi:RNA polymerase sigma-70 factor (ECF subfamily)